MVIRKLFFFFVLTACCCNAQVVIGSYNITPAAMLKLDSNEKALKVPVLSILNKTDGASPISSPANGIMVYNSNNNIAANIGKSLSWWKSNNEYCFQANNSLIQESISDSHIPVLIFSARSGQKPIIAVGNAGFTNVILSDSEIQLDYYSGWNSNQYKISREGQYIVEFISEISAPDGGTLSNRLITNGTNMPLIRGRYIPTLSRAFATNISAHNFTANTILNFAYQYTNSNYRLESGTINIYKY